MHETNIVLNGISAQSIYWNMPQAETLDIFKTVNSSYGIPGRIYAPLARTLFYSGRITGGLYVKSLEYNDSSMNLPTGQINNFDPSISGYLN